MYDGARRFLATALQEGDVVSDDAIQKYLIATGDAVLLFDDDEIDRHLRSIHDRIVGRNQVRERLKEAPDNIRDQLITKQEQDTLWLRDQSLALAAKFRPHIGLPKVKPLPWSR